VRVGLVCPYSFDVPGGVQAHVADLARTLIGMGHHVSVLAPGDDSEGAVEFPEFVVPSGRSVPIPYNGSVARLSFDARTSAGGTSGCAHAAHTSIESPRAKNTTRFMTDAFIML